MFKALKIKIRKAQDSLDRASAKLAAAIKSGAEDEIQKAKKVVAAAKTKLDNAHEALAKAKKEAPSFAKRLYKATPFKKIGIGIAITAVAAAIVYAGSLLLGDDENGSGGNIDEV